MLQKSVELKFDLNAKDDMGVTAFHMACVYDNTKIAKMLVQKSVEFKIDLNARCKHGLTAFQYACLNDERLGCPQL